MSRAPAMPAPFWNPGAFLPIPPFFPTPADHARMRARAWDMFRDGELSFPPRGELSMEIHALLRPGCDYA